MNKTSQVEEDREFVFHDRHFDFLTELAFEEAGIELNETKRELAYGRLTRRLRALNLSGFDEYCALIKPKGAPERANFVNAITTNLTAFYREEHHFDFLRDTAIPTLVERRADSRRIRMWSAACSTGQETYSMAITTASALPASGGWDCKILGTDIDSNVVAKANTGLYTDQEVPDLAAYGGRKKWFDSASGPSGETLQAGKAMRDMTYFRQLNLMESWPMSGPLDVIFCRNVVIYFSKETQRELFLRFAEILAPDGYLFIGHSESMLHSTDVFESIGRTIYRPVAGRSGAANA